MAKTALEKKFLGIWCRAQKEASLDNLTPELIRRWAEQSGLDVESVESCSVGVFVPTKCILLRVKEGSACFPTVPSAGDPDWQLRHDAAEHRAALWEKMEWFSPFWISMGDISKILKDASLGDRQRALDFFEYHTSTSYTLAFQAVCIAQIFPKANCLRQSEALAREAYLAFYSGYRAASIAALIPAIEGAINTIVAGDKSQLPIPEKVDRAFQGAIQRAANLHFNGLWAPPEYLTPDYLFAIDERIYSFETFRRWLRRSFFCNTDQYDGVTWLNRHVFAHGGSAEWQQASNFVRLLVALSTLGLVDSWHHNNDEISLFFPEMSDASKLLHQQAMIRAHAQGAVLRIEEKHFHENGSRVPPLPTDNGVLLRKAILSDECIKDLVRPLRDAGWSVDVGEPDEDALHVSVTATDGEERWQVSLLYSCATGNDIYKKLAENSTAVLYRGPPYHQQSYAHGIEIHVGPVTAWQPPLAPSRLQHLRELALRDQI